MTHFEGQGKEDDVTREDMVDVKLTSAGEALAGGRMLVNGYNYEYCFVPGKPVRMSSAEFTSRLQKERHQGQDVFEIVAEETAKAEANSSPRLKRVSE